MAEDTCPPVGGCVLGRLGRRARVGDVVEVESRKLRVEAIDGLRVAKVWLSTAATKHDEDTEAGEDARRS